MITFICQARLKGGARCGWATRDFLPFWRHVEAYNAARILERRRLYEAK